MAENSTGPPVEVDRFYLFGDAVVGRCLRSLDDVAMVELDRKEDDDGRNINQSEHEETHTTTVAT